MRISDWSAYVCSSDLLAKQQGSGPRRGRQDIRPAEVTRGGVCKRPTNSIIQTSSSTARRPLKRRVATPPRQKRDRKSVVYGKSVSVSVDLGGRRIIKKKKKKDRTY